MAISRSNMQVFAIMAVSITTSPLIPVDVAKVFDKSTLVVNVLDAGYPVPGSKVTIISEGTKDETKWVTNEQGYAVPLKDATGEIEIILKSGNYFVKVEKEGFLDKKTKIFLEEDGFAEKIVKLDPSNRRPIPSAGPEQFSNPKRLTLLDGTYSYDPDIDEGDDPLKGITSITWDLISRPDKSNLTLPPAEKREFYFTPDVTGDYKFRMTVSDGELEASKDHVVHVASPFENIAKIPTHVGGHITQRIRNKVYLAGGWNGEFLNNTYVYDIDMDTWKEIEPMKIARNHHASYEMNNKIFIFGGNTSAKGIATDSVEILNPSTGKWREGAPMPTPRYNATAVAHRGNIYVLGGVKGEKAFEIYDPQSNKWSKAEDMPTGRYRHTAQIVKNKIYLIGGKGTEELVEIFDIDSGKWSQGLPMPTGRYYLDSAVLDEKIYVVGGHGMTEGAGEPAAEVYDPKRNTWVTKNPLPFALDIHSMVTFNDKIYVFGGESQFGSFNTVDTTFVYDPRFDIAMRKKPTPKKKDEAK